MANTVHPVAYPPVFSTTNGYSGQNQYQTQYSTPVQTQPAPLPAYSANSGATVPPPAYYSQPVRPHTQNRYGNTVQITPAVIPVIQQEFPPMPFQTKCATCQEMVMTETKRENGQYFWHMCLILTVTCWCCVIPCCPAFKDVVHYCPRCKNELGRHCPNRRGRYVQPVPQTVIHRAN